MFYKFPVYFGPETDGSAGGASMSSGTEGMDSGSAENPFVGSSAPNDSVRVGAPEKAPEELHKKPVQQAPVQAAPPPMTLTPEQIAELAANAALRVQKPADKAQGQAVQQPQQRQVTEQEFNQHFGVVNLDAKSYADIMGFMPEKPEHVAALNNYGQGLVRQALRMSQFVFQQEVAKIRDEFGGQFRPLLETHKQTVERQLRDEFFSVHPDLKDHSALIDEIVTNLRLSKHQFQGEGSQQKLNAFTYVADRARTLLSRSAPQGNNPASQQPTSAQPAQRRMTPMSMGGAQSGGGSATNKPTNDAVAIFG